MSSDAREFQPVTFQKEREKLLADLQSKSTVLAGLTVDQHQFLFNVHHVQDETLYLELVAPVGRALRVGEPIEITFGLPDGQYLLKTKVDAVDDDRAAIPFGNDVSRLQRRNNFRTNVPAGYKITFRLTSLKTSVAIRGATLETIDLSAGGMRVKWPVASAGQPKEGDSLTGVLVLPSGKQLELFAAVKKVYPQSDGTIQAGVEFQNLSIRDEQTLLFVCMEIHRHLAPAVKS